MLPFLHEAFTGCRDTPSSPLTLTATELVREPPRWGDGASEGEGAPCGPEVLSPTSLLHSWPLRPAPALPPQGSLSQILFCLDLPLPGFLLDSSMFPLFLLKNLLRDAPETAGLEFQPCQPPQEMPVLIQSVPEEPACVVPPPHSSPQLGPCWCSCLKGLPGSRQFQFSSWKRKSEEKWKKKNNFPAPSHTFL